MSYRLLLAGLGMGFTTLRNRDVMGSMRTVMEDPFEITRSSPHASGNARSIKARNSPHASDFASGRGITPADAYASPRRR